MAYSKSTEKEQLASEISGHPFLRGLTPAFLNTISEGAIPKMFQPGEFLVREDEEAQYMFLIYSGKVAVELPSPDHPPITIETVGAGGVVGWSWCLPRHRYEHDARAVKPTHAIALDAPNLFVAAAKDPEHGYQFMTRLLAVVAERLANTRMQLVAAQRS